MKETSNLNLSITHYLTSGFAIPFIANIFFAIVILPLVGEKTINIMGMDQKLVYVIAFFITIASLVLGVIYSCSYINKNYTIKDNRNFLKLSSWIFFIFTSLFLSYKGGAVSELFGEYPGNTIVIILGVILISGVGTMVFYKTTESFLKEY